MSAHPYIEDVVELPAERLGRDDILLPCGARTDARRGRLICPGDEAYTNARCAIVSHSYTRHTKGPLSPSITYRKSALCPHAQAAIEKAAQG